MNPHKQRRAVPRLPAPRSRPRVTRRPRGLLALLGRVGFITPPRRD